MKSCTIKKYFLSNCESGQRWKNDQIETQIKKKGIISSKYLILLCFYNKQNIARQLENMNSIEIRKQLRKLQFKFTYLFVLFLYLSFPHQVSCIQLYQKKHSQYKKDTLQSLLANGRQAKSTVNQYEQQNKIQENVKIKRGQNIQPTLHKGEKIPQLARLLQITNNMPQIKSSSRDNVLNKQGSVGYGYMPDISTDFTINQLKNSELQNYIKDQIKNSLNSLNQNPDLTSNIQDYLNQRNSARSLYQSQQDQNILRTSFSQQKPVYMPSSRITGSSQNIATKTNTNPSYAYQGYPTLFSNTKFQQNLYPNTYANLNSQYASAYDPSSQQFRSTVQDSPNFQYNPQSQPQFQSQLRLQSQSSPQLQSTFGVSTSYSLQQSSVPQYSHQPEQRTIKQQAVNSIQYGSTSQYVKSDSSNPVIVFNQNMNQPPFSSMNNNLPSNIFYQQNQPTNPPSPNINDKKIQPSIATNPAQNKQITQNNFTRLVRDIIRPIPKETFQPQKNVNIYLPADVETTISTQKNDDGTIRTTITPNISRDYIKSQITNNLVNQLIRLVDNNDQNSYNPSNNQSVIRFKNVSLNIGARLPQQSQYSSTANLFNQPELPLPKGGSNIVLSSMDSPLLSYNQSQKNKTYMRIQNYIMEYMPSDIDISKDDIKAYRQSILNLNIDVVNSHNSQPNKTYQMGPGPFAPYSPEQFNSKFAKLKVPEEFNNQADTQRTDMFTKLPQIVIDWRCKASSVVSQGVCGACYVIAALQSIYITTKINRQDAFLLSNQQVISCSKRTPSLNGCTGGFFTGAFEYVRIFGVGQNFLYPYDDNAKYLGVETPCNVPLITSPQYEVNKIKIRGYDRIQPGNCIALINMLKVRSIPVAIASFQFQFYVNGTFSTQSRDTNHGVTLVGYYPDQGFLIKNSWGVTWGNLGYGFVDRSTRICDFAVAPVIAVEGNPMPSCSKKEIQSLGIQPQMSLTI